MNQMMRDFQRSRELKGRFKWNERFNKLCKEIFLLTSYVDYRHKAARKKLGYPVCDCVE